MNGARRIRVQRLLIGGLALICAGLWWFGGQDSRAFQQQTADIETILDAARQERALHQEMNQTIHSLFQALSACACEGDLAHRRALWRRFEALVRQEQAVAAQVDAHLEAYGRQP